jgi:serine/threonine protein kinase
MVRALAMPAASSANSCGVGEPEACSVSCGVLREVALDVRIAPSHCHSGITLNDGSLPLESRMRNQPLQGRYEFLHLLSSTGGCGQTYLGQDNHKPSQPKCVIKELHPQTTDPVTYQLIKDRFVVEGRILEQLGQHDQIPELYAYIEDGGDFFIVQEFIEGTTLQQKCRQLSEAEIKKLLISLLEVLDYVHSQKVIHRDIKPTNIILRARDNKPVLIDFGVIKEVISGSGQTTAQFPSVVLGTPGYMPLEQIAGLPVLATDLYSLGYTIIYLLTGKQPTAMWKQYVPNISAGLIDVLDKATQQDKRDRYQTAQEMLQAVLALDAPTTQTTRLNKKAQQRAAQQSVPSRWQKVTAWWARQQTWLSKEWVMFARIPLALVVCGFILVTGIATGQPKVGVLGFTLLLPIALGWRGTIRKLASGFWVAIGTLIMFLIYLAQIQGRI